MFTRLYNGILSLFPTLLRLFRGNKYNVLRKKEDSSDFTVFELYLGVLIITLCIFLLPTVAIFYFYAFVWVILRVLLLQLVLLLAQRLVTEFPYCLLV